MVNPIPQTKKKTNLVPLEKSSGRPEKPINWELFEQLCACQCTQSETASMLKVDRDTLRDRARVYYKDEDYSAIYNKFAESGKCSVRRNQFVMTKTNASMAIFWGKNHLGQSDGRDNYIPPADKSISSDLDYINKIGQLLNRVKELEGKYEPT